MGRVENLARMAAEALIRHTQAYRLLVLYPRHRQYGVLISLLHKHYGDLFYFYTLNHEDRDLRAFVRHFANDAMFPVSFGQHTRQSLAEEGASEAAWGRALAQDINELGHQQAFILFWNNFDHLPKDEVQISNFCDALVSGLAPQAQVMIHGRDLRRQPWGDLQAKRLALCLGNEELLGSSLFEEPTLRGDLDVYALGGGARVLVDGRPLIAWEGSLSRDLFYFFMDRTRISRAEVFRNFWPEMSSKEASNTFHVTKRKISEKLGYDLTLYEDGYYLPNPHLNRNYDVATFESYLELGLNHKDRQEAQTYLLKALACYKGQFLKDLDESRPWVGERRQQLRTAYGQGLMALGAMYEEDQQLDEALRYFIRASEENLGREDVHRRIMSIYAKQKNMTAVEIQYQALWEVLHQQFGIRPSSETISLYHKLMGN